MATSTNDVAPEIRGWLKENVTGGRDVAIDERLIERGVLTSLQTVELVMFLEERFGIVVEDEEFDEDNFGSVEAIAGLVASKATCGRACNIPSSRCTSCSSTRWSATRRRSRSWTARASTPTGT